MEYRSLIDALTAEGARLLDAADYDPGADVEACPGWDVTRLVVHVGQVHDFLTRVAEAGGQRPDGGFVQGPDGADAQETIEWERGILDRLVATLRARSADDPAWTWGSEQNVAWVARRMTHETLVHRLDVELAVGAPTEVDSDLAADGVDELIHVGLQFSSNPKKQFSYPEGSLHLHRTDGEGEWLLRGVGGSLTATREHAKGDVAVRAKAPDLLRYLWGRSFANLDVFGDVDLARAWQTVGP